MERGKRFLKFSCEEKYFAAIIGMFVIDLHAAAALHEKSLRQQSMPSHPFRFQKCRTGLEIWPHSGRRASVLGAMSFAQVIDCY